MENEIEARSAIESLPPLQQLMNAQEEREEVREEVIIDGGEEDDVPPAPMNLQQEEEERDDEGEEVVIDGGEEEQHHEPQLQEQHEEQDQTMIMMNGGEEEESSTASDELSSEDKDFDEVELEEKLALYKERILQIENALNNDPNNEMLQKAKQELMDVIMLTDDLLRANRSAKTNGPISEEKTAPSTPSALSPLQLAKSTFVQLLDTVTLNSHLLIAIIQSAFSEINIPLPGNFTPNFPSRMLVSSATPPYPSISSSRPVRVRKQPKPFRYLSDEETASKERPHEEAEATVTTSTPPLSSRMRRLPPAPKPVPLPHAQPTPPRRPSKSSSSKKRKSTPKRTTYYYDPDLLTSPDSILLKVNLRNVCNFNAFNMLSAEEKDSLLQYLPNVDRESEESIKALFRTDAFAAHLTIFKTMLSAGEFDTKNQDDYRLYLRGKRQRDQQPDLWKKKYYEEYWGQKAKIRDQEEPKPPTPTFSFVELEKQQAERNGSENGGEDEEERRQREIAENIEDDEISVPLFSRSKKRRREEQEEEEEEEDNYIPKPVSQRRRKKPVEAAPTPPASASPVPSQIQTEEAVQVQVTSPLLQSPNT